MQKIWNWQGDLSQESGQLGFCQTCCENRCNLKGWLPRAKLRPLVEVLWARPIRSQDFRWPVQWYLYQSLMPKHVKHELSHHLTQQETDQVWYYWHQSCFWSSDVNIFIEDPTYKHSDNSSTAGKKTDCFRVATQCNEAVKLQGCEWMLPNMWRSTS